MSDSETSNIEKPDLTIGSYRLLEPLGSGGMSSVFRAVHIETGHEVAVKVLPRSLAKNSTMLQRFLREAKSAEALEHPNIVAIYDRGVDQGRNYLVLEFVKGGDLHDRVRNEGPLTIAEAIAVTRSVCEGLKYASEHGVIHRDIKPANLLLSPDGRVKIIDLGLALKSESEDERVTRDGTTVGTVDYMAPEQARDSRATSERSDIYSLGCTLYFLLTGSAPFPGGDIADKLTRHCTKPAPDPCEIRPDVPRPLGMLVRKMMAKRPENRFQDYTELIEALDGVPVSNTVEPEDALVDEDDAAGIPLAPIESGVTAALLAGNGRGNDPRSHHGASINLAELAEDDGSTPPPRRRPAPPAMPPKRSDLADDPEPLDDDEGEEMEEGDDEEELVEDLASGRMAPAADSESNVKTRKWVYAGIGGTVGVVLLAIVVNLLIPHPKPPTPPKPPEDTITELSAAPIQPEVPPPPPPVVKREPAPAPGSIARGAPVIPPPTVPEAAVPKVAAPAPTRSDWVEPGDPGVELPAEAVYAPDVEAKFALPAWAKTPIPQRLTGSVLKVRRIIEPSSPQERSSLAAAFELINADTTEVIDDGPVIVADFRLLGDAHLVRAGPARRPIIRLDGPKLDATKEQSALFVLDGKQLILDGIDLIVDLQDLPRKQTALFACKGGSLVLNRCTITVHNPQNQPFSLIRAQGGDRPSQIRIKESFLRGSSISLVEMAGGGVEVVIDRSVLVGGQGPMIVSAGTAAGGDRRVHLHRSILANRGPILDLTSPDASRPAAVTVRALGTTFARFASDAIVSLISFHEQVAEIKDCFNWMGENNSFQGWSDWSSTGGSAHTVKLASLANARTLWPMSDTSSQESPNPWFDQRDVSRLIPEQLRALAPQGLPTLSRVASPSPELWGKTIEEFKRPDIPTFDSPIPTLRDDGGGVFTVVEPVFNPAPMYQQPQFVAPGTPGPPGAPGAPGVSGDPTQQVPVPVKELLFDVAAPPIKGDLGRFLREQVKPGDVRVRVRVSGTGGLYFTPVRLPDGTSLEVIVENSRVRNVVPPVWRPFSPGPADALIDVKGGDLVLNGVEILRDASTRPLHLIRVEDGHLILNRCRLYYQPRTQILQPGSGHLIMFRAKGTAPFPPTRPSPFSTLVDRAGQPFDRTGQPVDKPSPPIDKPVCRILESVLIAPGDVLTAEVGRGLISLSECVIEAGGTIFTLNPAKVARSRFEADLSIERCTLAAEKTFVLLGPWLGTTPGPDRPWLVNSRASAYLSRYNPVSKESVLLRVEPNSLSMGALFWQGYNDAYEVTNFTARNDKPVAPNPYPDVYRQWTNFWGANHFRNSTGPTRNSKPSVAFHDPLKANTSTMAFVAATDLALDPDVHPGRSEVDVGANMRLIQVVNPRRPSRTPQR